MAFKPSGKGFDPRRLLSNLTNARIQDENNALYQTLFSMIQGLSTFDEQIQSKLDKNSKINLLTQVEGILNYYNGGVQSNIYLPVLTNIANIDASGAYYTPWFRTGNIINVSGKFIINPTAINTFTELEFTLPVASNFAHEEECSGTANGIPFSGSTTGFPGIVTANPATGNAIVRFYSTNTDDNDVRFIFSYRFIPK